MIISSYKDKTPAPTLTDTVRLFDGHCAIVPLVPLVPLIERPLSPVSVRCSLNRRHLP